MPRRPTVYDVAERAGVSIATVSFTFRQPERVRESTRDAVLAAARELGYVPSASARGLAHGSTGALGLYAFDLMLAAPQSGAAAAPPPPSGEHPDSDPRAFPLYVDEVQRGVELECWQRGQALLLSSGSGTGAAVTEIAGRVDGLAMFPGPTPVEALEHVARRIPVVAFSMPPVADGLHHVTVDNRAGMRDLVGHLVGDHGLRDLAFVGRLTTPDYAERFAGFREALAAAGLPEPAEPLDPTDLAEPHRLEVVAELADADRLPRALVCASDQHALAVLDLLAARGIPAPERVVVTGFDGILAGRLTRPSLTTVRQPMVAMGRLAVQVLVRHAGTAAGEPESHRLPVEVVRRESCGCPGV
ncbi:substrate-binding domain-containing protein [Cellulomonas hominis]|uniref:substrate-binding domain-containing protein n=1 Tax=Cellulomonas hominis TaxID=156981 RepID=UPI001443AD20|nr:LacI family transcriptional regulator [Cellulomonas hominis]